MANLAFFIKYANKQLAKIKTLFDEQGARREDPLFDVADMIGSSTSDTTRRLLGLPDDYGLLTLHTVMDGVEGPALEPDYLLSNLTTGITAKTALVIKSQDDMENVQNLDMSRRYSDPWGNDIATLLGNSGSSDSEGVSVRDYCTVARDEVVTNILNVFQKNNPLLIKSPPFSGKTSMATLMSHRLKTVATEKCLDNSSRFDHLQKSRAFSSVKNVSDEELQLVNIVFSEGMIIENSSLQTDEKLIAESLVLKGVFVEYGAMNEQYVFSSPVMRRYFTEKVFGVPAGRSQENSTSLYNFIYAVLSSIDYNHIQSSLGKTKKTGILLEQAWQMEIEHLCNVQVIT